MPPSPGDNTGSGAGGVSTAHVRHEGHSSSARQANIPHLTTSFPLIPQSFPVAFGNLPRINAKAPWLSVSPFLRCPSSPVPDLRLTSSGAVACIAM